MSANQAPIFTATPDLSNNATPTTSGVIGGAITSAAADFTGVSANYVLEHTAGTNGSFIERLRFKGIGTNVQTVARIFINNGNTPGTASNNAFYGEQPLPATTSNATGQTGPDIDYQMNVRLPPGWRIYVGLATAVSAGWNVVAVSGQY